MDTARVRAIVVLHAQHVSEARTFEFLSAASRGDEGVIRKVRRRQAPEVVSRKARGRKAPEDQGCLMSVIMMLLSCGSIPSSDVAHFLSRA